MTYEDTYRMSVHAVITNDNNEILLLRLTYGKKRWGLPGGAMDVGENYQETLIRECREELGIDVTIEYTSGIYYHEQHNSHVIICRCTGEYGDIHLSDEHSEYQYTPLSELSDVQMKRVGECLAFDGKVCTYSFK